MKRTRCTIRGLDYSVIEWGEAGAPPVFLLHGWMDVAASFVFLVDALRAHGLQRRFIAPDWRGFGQSAWDPHGYWFPDYLADLDALLDAYTPDAPATLIGHSMGGNVACLYAGARPQRVARIVDIDGFGLSPTTPDMAPARFTRWLDELKQTPSFQPYASFEALAERIRRDNPRVSAERALVIARSWAREERDASVTLTSDPRHKRVNPVLYRLEEAMACWRAVTAPTLWIGPDDSWMLKEFAKYPGSLEARKACIRDLKWASIEDAGHMVHWERPEALADVIVSFLEEDR